MPRLCHTRKRRLMSAQIAAGSIDSFTNHHVPYSDFRQRGYVQIVINGNGQEGAPLDAPGILPEIGLSSHKDERDPGHTRSRRQSAQGNNDPTMRPLPLAEVIGSKHFAVLGILLLTCTSLTADNRPASLAEASGNPLALNAMAFLGWYWKALLVLVGIAVLLRLFGGGLPARARSATAIGEDPYAMAYLAGGPQRVVDTAIASLVQRGALRVNAVTRELIAEREELHDAPKIERQVRGLLRGSLRVANAPRFRRRLQSELRPTLASMRDRLLRAGLLARPALQAKAVRPLAICFILLLGIATIRLISDFAAGLPVGFLVASMLVTGIAGWWLLRGMGRERATVAGERLLKTHRSGLGRGGDDRLWMVALLGLAGYGMGPMTDLHHVLQLSDGSRWFGWTGRGKGDSSGTGGCSAGASGCGGGGCGGGGCGG